MSRCSSFPSLVLAFCLLALLVPACTALPHRSLRSRSLGAIALVESHSGALADSDAEFDACTVGDSSCAPNDDQSGYCCPETTVGSFKSDQSTINGVSSGKIVMTCVGTRRCAGDASTPKNGPVAAAAATPAVSTPSGPTHSWALKAARAAKKAAKKAAREAAEAVRAAKTTAEKEAFTAVQVAKAAAKRIAKETTKAVEAAKQAAENAETEAIKTVQVAKETARSDAVKAVKFAKEVAEGTVKNAVQAVKVAKDTAKNTTLAAYQAIEAAKEAAAKVVAQVATPVTNSTANSTAVDMGYGGSLVVYVNSDCTGSVESTLDFIVGECTKSPKGGSAIMTRCTIDGSWEFTPYSDAECKIPMGVGALSAADKKCLGDVTVGGDSTSITCKAKPGFFKNIFMKLGLMKW